MTTGRDLAEGGGSAADRLNIITVAAVVVAIGAFLINQVYDLDVWWQVTIGNDILARHAIPVQDRFALAALGRPYHDSHWLFQVVLACAHRLGGMGGVEGAMVAIWGAALFFCSRAIRRWSAPPLSCILLFLAAMASMERFLPRPEIVTFLMISLFYLRLQEGKYRSLGDLALLGLLQAVWTNCHGLFVLGPFMAGCYWVVAAVRRVRNGDADFPALTRLLAVLLVATLLTPFGMRGWEYAFLLFTEVTPSSALALKSVGELSPTFGAATMAAPAFWFFAALLVLTVVAVVVAGARGRVSPQRLLIAAGLGIVAATGRRNMVLFALVASPFLAEHLPFVLHARSRRSHIVALASSVVMLAWAWFPLSGRYYLTMEIPSRFGWGATPSFFPHGLPPFLDRIGFKGHVYNSNTVGGFYLAHFYPQKLPLTDGRWEIYDRRVLEAIRNAPRDPVLWEQLVAAYDIRGLLLQHTSPEARALIPRLPADPRWRLVYYDHAASFWMRSDLPGLPPAVDLAAGGLPPKPARVDDCLILDVFLHDVGADDLHIRNLERIAAFGWETEHALEQIGVTQLKLGRWADAEQTFRQLEREFPKNVTALNELAFLAFRSGDPVGAESLLRRALELAPDDQRTRENYKRVRATLGGTSGGLPGGR